MICQKCGNTEANTKYGKWNICRPCKVQMRVSAPYKPPAVEANKETIKRLQKLHEQSMKRILTKQANGGYSNG